MRADAQKNVAAVLAAAKAVFADSGVDAPLQKVADLAGVGVGTLYRHFPRRSDLIIAVMQNEIDECIEAFDEFGRTLEPGAAVTAAVERFTAFVATKRGFAAALHSGDPAYEGLPQMLIGQLATAYEPLCRRAIDAGAMTGDLSPKEVLTAVALLSNAVPGEPASFNRKAVRALLAGSGVAADR